MSSRGLPVLTTFGLEIEFATIPKSVMREVSAATNWRLVSDGSTRSYCSTRQGLPIFIGQSRGERAEFGGELVSPLLSLEDTQWMNDVDLILDTIGDAGEGISLKTSIHVHINATGIPLFALKNLVVISQYLEDAFYRLSCAEAGIHRGALHLDYGFCRPITTGGPPVTHCSSGCVRPVFSTDALLNAPNSSLFRAALGRYDNWDGNKYHEARYTWINYVALYQHGSIEFRPFNMTLRPQYVRTWTHLCVETVRAAFGKPPGDLPINPLGSGKISLPDVVEFLMLDDTRLIYNLEELWNLAEYQRGIVGYQHGHLGQTVNWRGFPAELKPDKIDTKVHGFYDFRSDFSFIRPGTIRLMMGD